MHVCRESRDSADQEGLHEVGQEPRELSSLLLPSQPCVLPARSPPRTGKFSPWRTKVGAQSLPKQDAQIELLGGHLTGVCKQAVGAVGLEKDKGWVGVLETREIKR